MTERPYTLYYLDLSYYSGKLQAYLRYKRIPVREVYVSWWQLADRVLPQTGLMEVPVIERPDGTWMRDTTSIIEWFEPRHPDPPVLPDDPVQAFFVRLLEDYADEWMWPSAMHYRWHYAPDRWMNARRFTEEFLFLRPRWLMRLQIAARQYATYVPGEGTTGATRRHVEEIYARELRHLQAIFATRPFLLGDRPCLADFGYFASMFRHFSLDPTPRRIMLERAPAVYEWVARMWNARALERATPRWAAGPGTLPEDWLPLLRTIGATYLPYLAENARAVAAGAKRFDLEIEGVRYGAMPVSPFRAYCRERLQTFYQTLEPGARRTVASLLEAAGCLEPLQRYGHIEVSDPFLWMLPECDPLPVGRVHKLLYYVMGTPRHRRAR